MADTSKQTDSSYFPSSCSFKFWDVFLSFGGKDTRRNFIGNLYSALDQAGIRTFKDEPGLERGEEIAPQLIKAIHDSKMSIVVFSKNYASSKWCLNELAEILECERTRGHIILPVFYDVDPLNVRHQIESYTEAFEKHKIRYAEKIETWRAALITIANISGYDKKNDANGHEADLIQKIVNDVLRKLCPKNLNVIDHQVGIDSRVKEICQKLSIGSNDVHFIGIYGMTGIGKTTIIKALYNKIYKEFEYSCFLENVREAVEEPRGLHYLLEQLIFQLMKIKDFKVTSVDAGIRFVKQRLRSKKVLIVLDDLDEINQLESLAGNWIWFGSGSRIIVTTNNVRVLDEFQVDLRHEVEELDNNESLELFRWHAFRNTTPLKNNLMELSENIVRYVGGLPLALEVLGSSLFERTMVEWESVCGKMKKIPHNHIQKKLRISYNALDDDKIWDIFLDIACFFIGMDKDDAIKILDACGFFPEIGISILRERCLLTIDWNKLRMHNLIRDMGWEIVREESVKNPRKRSRLWFHEDAYDVLKKFKGHENIEGIRLVMPMQEKVDISSRAFHSLPNLRLLQISNVNLIGSFEIFFEELRWFCWYDSSLDCLPSSFQAPKLIFLDMQHNKVKILWEGTKQLQSLKILNATGSRFLKTTPDFKGLESLEKLIFQSCSSLSRIHPSIGFLHKLVHLDLFGCNSLNQLPEQLGNMRCLRELNASWSSIEQLPNSIGHLGKLEKLDLDGCKNLRNLPSSICYLTSFTYLNLGYYSKLESLPKNLGNLTSLMYLNLSKTNIMQLPDSIGHLGKLEKLDLDSCRNLRNLPSSICDLTSLTCLNLGYCSNLESLPKNLGNLTSLTYLHLAETNIMQFPDSIGHLGKLENLDLVSCNNLKNLPSSICHLTSLTYLNLGYCSNLESLPKNLGNLTSLMCLHLSETDIMQLPDSIRHLGKLEKLDLVSCKNLRNLPSSICDLTSLTYLNLGYCSNLENLPKNLGNLTSLTYLRLSTTNIMQLPHSIGCLTRLNYLDMSACKRLRLPSKLSQLVNLKELNVSHCSSLQSLPELPPNLSRLVAIGCTSLDKLPNLLRMNNLIRLDFSKCSSLQSLPKFRANLRRVDLDECWSLQFLPELPLSLGALHLENCTSLRSLQELPTDLGVLYLNNCTSLNSLPELPTNLINLELSNCTSLRSVPKLPCQLEYLDLTGCSSLESLQELPCKLEYLDLTGCSSLESLQELPCHLYSLNASGCKSLQKLPDLSNLTNMRRLILTDCSNLISNFIWSFLQDCSGHDGCDVYLPSSVIQDRFSHQRTGSSTSFQMPGDVRSNFLRMAFWVVFGGKLYSPIEAVITNETDGTQFMYRDYVQTTGVHAWVRSIGKPISMKSGDRIEVSFRGISEDVTVEMCGVHLDYKRVRDVDVVEPLCSFKRLKHQHRNILKSVKDLG